MSLGTRMFSVALLAGVVAVASALASSDASTFTVTSSLDGKTALPLRIKWIAHPQLDPSQGEVAEVDYLIDGFHAWTERGSPWSFGSDGDSLVTTVLKPGLHSFAVRAITLDGQMATDEVEARGIAAPRPPDKLAGTWKRIVGAGHRTITIERTGWMTGPNQWLDVRYQPNGRAVMGPEIVDRPEQTSGFCRLADPPHTWKVTLSADDRRMQLKPLGADPCRARVAVMQGTWTRLH